MSAINYDANSLDITVKAAANITGYTLIRFGSMPAGETLMSCEIAANASSPILGVAQVDDGVTVQTGQTLAVRVSGVSKAIAGGVIGVGSLVTAGANGRAVAATTGWYIGFAISPASSGDEFLVLIGPGFKGA